MNAVERLLAHAKGLLSLFDEMYRERMGSGRDPKLPEVPVGLWFTFGGRALDRMIEKPAGKRREWASGHWLQAAAEKVWIEEHKRRGSPPRTEFLPLKKRGSREAEATAAKTAELFQTLLEERKQFLRRDAIQSLRTAVVAESDKWGSLSPRVVSLADSLAEEVRRVGAISDDIEPLDWQRRKRKRLRNAIDMLAPYAQPSLNQPEPSKVARDLPANTTQINGKSRKGIGGAKRKGSPVNELHALRAKYEARCRRLKKTPDSLKQWLCDWGTAHDIRYPECRRIWDRENKRIERAHKQ